MILVLALAYFAATAASLWVAPGFEGIVGALLAGIMLAIMRSDWQSYRVPDRLNVLALTLRGADIALSPNPQGPDAFDSLFGALIASGAFYLFRAIYEWLRGREGLGLGDVKLAAVAGAWIDLHLLSFVVEFAALTCLTVALIRARGWPKADARVPFAVGFAPAIWFVWWLQRLPG